MIHTLCKAVSKMYLLLVALSVCLCVVNVVTGEQDNKLPYKDQFCTDPRTMQKHAAYTEWADAYSCTWHRCQPGGKNLAIYTVGCKRVEQPQTAKECEPVVEDTNMQFPYCCTRLRCLVEVGGEVWTRVLGQPWENLPAAPWSHMYKMKRPPPGAGDSSYVPKSIGEGPVYEQSLPVNAHHPPPPPPQQQHTQKHRHRHSRMGGGKYSEDSGSLSLFPALVPGSESDGDKPANSRPLPMPSPDIVIALTTSNDANENKKPYSDNEEGHWSSPNTRTKVEARNIPPLPADEDLEELEKIESEVEDPQSHDTPSIKEMYSQQQQPQQVSWTETTPRHRWTDEPLLPPPPPPPVLTQVLESIEEEKADRSEEKSPFNLQALVDAIGTRMRDIEDVVQKMSAKVNQGKKKMKKPSQEETSVEKRTDFTHYSESSDKVMKPKKSSRNSEHYRRFSTSNHGSKYVHVDEVTTERPLFVEDARLQSGGYFSDASNSVLRRSGPGPKEPSQVTYMAPIGPQRKTSIRRGSHTPSEATATRRKRKHKKRTKAGRGRGHKKNKSKEIKKGRRAGSGERDVNIVSMEDSSLIAPA